MATLRQRQSRQVRWPQDKVVGYDSQKKGLNTLLLDSELADDEARELTNLRRVGEGILQARPGTGKYFDADYTNKVRHLTDYYNHTTSTAELLAITDRGILVKKSGTSYAQITGASFASGVRHQSAQLGGNMFVVDGISPYVKYDGTNLITYAGIASPTNLLVTKSSGTSGIFTHSYRVSAKGRVGETLATTAVQIANVQELPTATNFITLNWTAPSAASGALTGYNIFGRETGGESFITSVESSSTSWIDDGTIETTSLLLFPQTSNSTSGPKAKHIISWEGKTVVANLDESTSRFQWSGVGQYVDDFSASKGGGYYDIDPNSKDRFGVTALSQKEGKLIVFKGNSVHQMSLSWNSSLGIAEPVVTKIIDGIGCAAAGTAQVVENSVMFVANIAGRGLALAKLDYEPNILSGSLRFQPISAAVQSVIDQVNMARVDQMWALYSDKRYHWFLPISATSWTCLVYDMESAAFFGPWTLTDAWSGTVSQDSENKYHALIGKSGGGVIELSDGYINDEGTNFTWRRTTKLEDFGQRFTLKTIVDAWQELRNFTSGTVSISYNTSGVSGNSVLAATVSVTAPYTLAGYGSSRYGYAPRYGYNPSTGSDTNSTTVRKYTFLAPDAFNVVAVQQEISGSGNRPQIVATQIRARSSNINNVPTEWRNA